MVGIGLTNIVAIAMSNDADCRQRPRTGR
jgi:hypothetical protein